DADPRHPRGQGAQRRQEVALRLLGAEVSGAEQQHDRQPQDGETKPFPDHGWGGGSSSASSPTSWRRPRPPSLPVPTSPTCIGTLGGGGGALGRTSGTGLVVPGRPELDVVTVLADALL